MSVLYAALLNWIGNDAELYRGRTDCSSGSPALIGERVLYWLAIAVTAVLEIKAAVSLHRHQGTRALLFEVATLILIGGIVAGRAVMQIVGYDCGI